MASTGADLRMLVGQRAVAKCQHKAVPAMPEEPVSPPGILVLDEEAMAAAAAHGRRRSSLNADTTFLEQVHAAEEEDEDVETDDMQQMQPLEVARVSSTVSQASCCSLLAGCEGVPGEPALPSFLVEGGESEKEGASRGGSGLMGLGEANAASESPSPSQRAALDALYDGGRGASNGSALAREAADVEEAETAAEVAAAVRVMDHLIADRIIQERPELRRYDSADAELEMAQRKQKKHHARGGRQSSPTEALTSQLQSELHLAGSDDEGSGNSSDGSSAGGGGKPASALEHPPRMRSNRRLSEGYIELPHEPEPQARADSEEPLGPPRPLLAHFDSGDYFKNEAERKAKGAAAPSGAGVVKPEARAGQQDGGHKAVASFFLHRRGR